MSHVARRTCTLLFRRQFSRTNAVRLAERDPANPTISPGSSRTLTGERGVNRVTLVGRLGRDPEVRGSAEKPVTLMSLATTTPLKSPDGTYTQLTDWHRVSVFRPVLQNWCANALRKGDRLYVSGAIQYRKYTDKNTEEVVNSTTIVADDVIKLGDSGKIPPMNNL